MSSLREFAADLARLKRYIFTGALIFIAGIAIGYGTDALDRFLLGQADSLRQTVERLDQMDNAQVWIFLFIFFNNFIKAVAVVFLGALFGIFPVFLLTVNGMLLGYIVSVAAESGIDAGSMVVRGILPHGVLELTAIIIAAAYGLRYGGLIFRELAGAIRGRRRDERGELKRFHGSLKRLIAFLFLSLLAAAFIESTITFWLVRG
ncbi:stage II sporulation protein M [Paenibacillus alkalitolerans]|uniref:stage II sporulation protein M n=1 Tax=Paenibacillus alkalitolerans TaxID=2799335 RepID=UPI0018F5A6D0|nr:stage II sporulation protein M [Paenibacillus alkalitolerans]